MNKDLEEGTIGIGSDPLAHVLKSSKNQCFIIHFYYLIIILNFLPEEVPPGSESSLEDVVLVLKLGEVDLNALGLARPPNQLIPLLHRTGELCLPASYSLESAGI
jgi:hypothetical protein